MVSTVTREGIVLVFSEDFFKRFLSPLACSSMYLCKEKAKVKLVSQIEYLMKKVDKN
jgi:hypothetical protein